MIFYPKFGISFFSIWQTPPTFSGVLLPNDILTHGEHLLKGSIHSPEAILIEGDLFYTGTMDGKIIQVGKDGFKKKETHTNLTSSSRKKDKKERF